MRKRIRSFAVCLALVLLLIPADTLWAAGTDQIATVGITVQYGQTEARSMLDMINAFRTGADAWAYDESGNKVAYGGLSELRYDRRLEEAAMQRAAEIAVYWSHERPNGTDCFTVYDGINGENIAAGSRTAAQVFELWQETDEDYSGQGHRRNMLESFGSVGIGHVYFNGRHFWVQEFGYGVSAEEVPAANDAETSVQIDVREDYILERRLDTVQEQSVVYGEAAELPALTMRMRLTETWPQVTFPVNTDCTWTVEDETVASIENGKIVGKKVGRTALRSNEIADVTVPLVVTPSPIGEAQIQLSAPSCVYDGTAQTPEIRSVTLKGRTLIPDEDYAIAYMDNTRPGTAKVVVTGIGNYQGTAEQSFEIICEHQFDQGQVTREATCTEDGERLYTCSFCQSTKTEPIPATGHAFQTSITKATVKKDGMITEKCGLCGAVKSQKPIRRPKTIKLSAKSYVYNGKEKRPSVAVTDLSGKTIRPQEYRIDYAKGRRAVGTYKVTVIFRGDRYTGQMSDTFTIRPPKVSLNKVQDVRGKKMRVQWKRAVSVSGYQIQYGTASSFKGARSLQVSSKKTAQTIGKLVKGKRYYVRIRAYKTVSGRPIYSDWSAKKSVVVRK